MPNPAVISESNTPARMMAPSRVFSMRAQSATAIARPKTMTKRRYDGMVAPKTVTEPEKSAGVGMERMRPPQIHLTRSSKT